MRTVSPAADTLSPEEIAAGRRNWALMPADMREFFTALVEAGLTDNTPSSPLDGRRALANVRVAIAPETLPPSGGVAPYIPTRAEREAIEATRNRGRRT